MFLTRSDIPSAPIAWSRETEDTRARDDLLRLFFGRVAELLEDPEIESVEVRDGCIDEMCHLSAERADAWDYEKEIIATVRVDGPDQEAESLVDLYERGLAQDAAPGLYSHATGDFLRTATPEERSRSLDVEAGPEGVIETVHLGRLVRAFVAEPGRTKTTTHEILLTSTVVDALDGLARRALDFQWEGATNVALALHRCALLLTAVERIVFQGRSDPYSRNGYVGRLEHIEATRVVFMHTNTTDRKDAMDRLRSALEDTDTRHTRAIIEFVMYLKGEEVKSIEIAPFVPTEDVH